MGCSFSLSLENCIIVLGFLVPLFVVTSHNYAKSIIESSNGIIYAIELLLKGEFENHHLSYNGNKGHYTTPSMFSFLRIYSNWKQMKRKYSNDNH